jgi:putative SOS response-associated peptidase YedK
MCAGAQLTASAREIIQAAAAAGLDVRLADSLRDASWDHRVWGFGHWDSATRAKSFETTPAIIATATGPELHVLEFSLTPAWAREYPLKASTYNARCNRPKRPPAGGKTRRAGEQSPLFEYVYEYPAYRSAWASGRFCLVPLTAGIESSYAGAFDQQRFSFSLRDGGLMFLLGLWDEWTDRNSGEVHRGFALLTAYPQTAMRQYGHHREVVMVDHVIWPALLDGSRKTGADYQTILRHRLDPDYDATHYAALKTRGGAPTAEDFLYPEEDLMLMGEKGRAWIAERRAACAR